MLIIKDYPGVRAVAGMRAYFEGAIAKTESLRTQVPVEALTDGGEFAGYTDPATHAMWVGFALGMRCADRESQVLSRSVTEGGPQPTRERKKGGPPWSWRSGEPA